MTKRPRSLRKQPTGEQPCTTTRARTETSAWIPDPMQLAQLAGRLHLRENTANPAQRALQEAWAFFADSVALCAMLRQASPQKLRDLYGSIPGIAHSGMVLQMIGESGPPPKTLRFYPQRPHTDLVREFFGVQKARTVKDNIKEYCLAHQEEDNGCLYDGILEESKGVEGAETYHDLPLEFLKKIKAFKHEIKVQGGSQKNRPRLEEPLRMAVSDDCHEEKGSPSRGNAESLPSM